MISRLSNVIRHFGRDDRGAATIDYIPAFFAVIVVVLLIFEIGIAYFLNIRSHKAAQLGARVAATLPAVHNGVPSTNVRSNALGRMGEPCFNPIGTSRCVNPGGPWVCSGHSLGGNCDAVVFGKIVDDMRRTFPDLTDSAVTISYIYRELGEAGGPFIPEVNVAIEPHEYQFVIFQLGRRDALNNEDGGELTSDGRTRYSGVSASAFAEDLSGS